MYGDNANHVKLEREERERQRKQQADQEANMHPAWAAKRATAAALAAAPKGRKVAFGEDGAAAGDLGHAHRHLVARQRVGLVGADYGGGAA